MTRLSDLWMEGGWCQFPCYEFCYDSLSFRNDFDTEEYCKLYPKPKFGPEGHCWMGYKAFLCF